MALAADMGTCSRLQEGQKVMEAGDGESTSEKYHYMFTLA